MQSAITQQNNETNELKNELISLEGQLKAASVVSSEIQSQLLDSKEACKEGESHIEDLKTQLSSTKSEVGERMDEIKVLKETIASAPSNAAAMRRLDNERLYLKNQLMSEIAIKADLKEKFQNTNQELEETKSSCKTESDELDESLRMETTKRENAEMELKSIRKAFATEVKVKTDKINESKQAYKKARDQLHIEQVSVDQMQAANQRLTEEHHAAQEELLLAKGSIKSTISAFTGNTIFP